MTQAEDVAENWAGTNEAVRDLHRALITNDAGDTLSVSEVGNVGASHTTPVLPTQMQPKIMEPGGFRRDFLRRRAEETGAPAAEVWETSLLDDMSSRRGLLSAIASYQEFPFGFMFDEEGNLIERSQRNVKADASNAQVAIGIFKAFVAEGIMFLPGAFANGGWLASPTIMAAMAYFSKVGIFMLVDCHSACPGALGDIAEEAAGVAGRVAVEVSLVLSQFAICCAMLIFTYAASEAALDGLGLDSMTYRLRATAIILIPLVPLSWIRNVQKLAIPNLVANVFIIFGVGMSVYYFVSQSAEEGLAASAIPFKPDTIAIFIGTAAYTFEGIPLMLPIYESMKHKQDFRKVFNRVFWVGCAGLEIFYGLIGYVAFGAEIEPVSILSVPITRFTRTVMVLFAVSVVLSFPMMFVPATRIVESLIWTKAAASAGDSVVDLGGLFQTETARKEQTALRRKVGKNVLRSALVVLLCAISIYGSNFVLEFVAMAGSLCCVPLAFVYPGYFYIRLAAKTKLQKAQGAALMVGGLVLIPVTFYQVVTNKSEGGE